MSLFAVLGSIAVKTSRSMPEDRGQRTELRSQRSEIGSQTLEVASALRAPTSDLCLGGWARFWFTPVQAGGLHWLRVLCGLLFLFWLVPFAGHQVELFSLRGWSDERSYMELS